MTRDKKCMEVCRVRESTELAPGIFSLWLEAPEIAGEAKPGQFVNLYSKDKSRQLPRPISLCEIDRQAGRVRLVYRVTGAGTGTEEFSRLCPGESIRVLGPLGKGFPVEEAAGKRVLLTGGGIGVPPLLETGKALLAVGSTPVFLLGYRDRLFLDQDFAAVGEVVIATEDGSAGTRGTVLDAARQQEVTGDLVFSCGPKPMLRAVAAWAQEKGLPCWVSMEERMACGVGACLGCVCQSTREDPHFHTATLRVCADGPVFSASEVIL